MVKKIDLSTFREDQFLYPSFKFDYKVSSKLLQCFSLCFLVVFSRSLLLLLYFLSFFSPPSMCMLDGWS